MTQRTPKLMMALSIILFLSFCQSVLADDITILTADSKLHNGTYFIDADIRYRLTEEVREALINGVPIQFSVEVEVMRIRSWLWNSTEVEKSFPYILRYRVLAKHYQLINLTTNRTTHFKALRRALAAMGTVRKLPLAKIDNLVRKEHYRVHLRAKLDIEALPLPLQPAAHFSSDWALVGKWFSWRLDI